MSAAVQAMPKKSNGPKQPGKSGGEGKTTAKLDAALHRRAKAVAAYKGIDLAEYLDAIIRPAVDRDFGQMVKDAGQE